LILGEAEAAMTAFDAGLSLAAAGEHQIWPSTAGARLRSLLALNDAERAATEGRIYLRAAEEAEIGYAVHYIDMPLAVAEAKLGDADAASRRADQVIADFQRLECQGVNLGLAYETRARVALYAGDRDNAEAYIGRAASVLRASQSRTAKARHLRLQQELREQFGDVDTAAGAGLELSTQAGFTSLISTMMHKCETAEARAHQGLSILIAHSQSLGGYLYAAGRGGLQLVASIGLDEPSDAITSIARQAMADEIELNEEETETGAFDESADAANVPAQDRHLRSVVVSHQTAEGFVVTAVAVLRIDLKTAFVPPNDVARVVSKLLVEAGDTAVLA
jgi:hypothetical protein